MNFIHVGIQIKTKSFMITKKIILFVLVFTFFHNFKICSEENTNNEHIISETPAYNEYIKEILNILKDKFDCLKEHKKFEEVLQLIVQIHVKELEYLDKYQFISAQDSRYFSYQVIAKELYEAINETKIQDFEFLRYPSNTLTKNPQEFFKTYPFLKHRLNESNPDYFDALPEISYQLLSASFSIDTYVPADSALFVFFYGKGVAEWFNTKDEDLYNKKFIQNISAIFDSADIDSKIYQPYLNQLIDAAPKTNEGIINQIFLPREKIENYLYAASSCGFLNVEKNINLHQTIDNFQKSRFDNFNLKENMQVRLIVGSLFDKDVNIYRYTLIPTNEQERYKKLVKEIVNQILLNH